MILGIVQARMGSSRLPGKTLMPIVGRPMLELLLERVRRSRLLNRIVVATTQEPEDLAIANLCEKLGIGCQRGSTHDVLDRFYQAARFCHPLHVVRITGDCPLIDPTLIDEMIEFYIHGEFDYVSNALIPSFPDGLDAEIFRFAVLERVWREATLTSEREHVTPLIYKHPEIFRVKNYSSIQGLSSLRWTVDAHEDFLFVSRIFEALYTFNAAFGYTDVLDLLHRHPELLTLNARFRRNEGYAHSLETDLPFQGQVNKGGFNG
ncbi:MAG: glycosyltransferase family protein [Elusimicrobia bacterium]|nr:glycosyltransferase family protein [Elusimicrobiota bacterium]